MIRRAIPPLFMILPARIKSGTAKSEKLSTPVFIFCSTMKLTWSKFNEVRPVTAAASTIETLIGTLKASKKKKTANKTTAVKAIDILLLLCSLLGLKLGAHFLTGR